MASDEYLIPNPAHRYLVSKIAIVREGDGTIRVRVGRHHRDFDTNANRLLILENVARWNLRCARRIAILPVEVPHHIMVLMQESISTMRANYRLFQDRQGKTSGYYRIEVQGVFVSAQRLADVSTS